MQAFRKAVLDNANERGADVVILADRTKLQAPGGAEIEEVDWSKQTVWLFLDVPANEKSRKEVEQTEVFKKFRAALKDRFVTVQVPEKEDRA